jgi:hypothetical protein
MSSGGLSSVLPESFLPRYRAYYLIHLLRSGREERHTRRFTREKNSVFPEGPTCIFIVALLIHATLPKVCFVRTLPKV